MKQFETALVVIDMQAEFDVIRAIVDARTSQNLTQK